MRPEQIERFAQVVRQSASEYPLVFLDLMVRRALSGHNTDRAIEQFANACQDMARWYAQQADALEAEGRARGLNVVSMTAPETGQ